MNAQTRGKIFSIFTALTLLFQGSAFSFAPFALADNHEENLALIYGHKWEDLNGDGAWDDGEPPLEDWTITLDNGDEDTTTDEDGYYEFWVDPGGYVVCEELPANWLQTYPDEDAADVECDNGSFGYEVEVADSDESGSWDFGNFHEGYISGHKYDLNTDSPVEGWTIHAVYPNGSMHHWTTGEDGYYYFGDLGPGQYQVCEEMTDVEECTVHPDQIYPDGFYFIEMMSDAEGLDNPDYDFWNQEPPTGTILGYKFEDLDQDGNWCSEEEYDQDNCDTLEPGIEGWTVALGRVGDSDGDGPIPIEIIAMDLTGVDGSFVVSGIPPGEYKLFEESRDGWVPTTPSPFIVESFFDISYGDFGFVPLVQDSFFDVFVDLDGAVQYGTRHDNGDYLDYYWNDIANFGNRQVFLPVLGCTDPTASNFDEDAIEDDGSCQYPEPPAEENEIAPVVSGETVAAVDATSITVTWITDHPTTSRVVYDTVSHPVLGSAPNYGYASSTATFNDPVKVVSHSVTISGLTPGTTYYFRTVSSGSPTTVGEEKTSQTSANPPPPPPPATTTANTPPPSTPSVDVLGEAAEEKNDLALEEVVDYDLNLNDSGRVDFQSGNVQPDQSFNLWRTIWPWTFGSAFLILLAFYRRRRNKR